MRNVIVTEDVPKPETQTEDRAAIDHTVVVFGVPDDSDTLLDVVLSIPDMDRPTGSLIVHSLPGVIPHEMTQNDAAELATEIRKLGVSATAIPVADVPDLSHAIHSHHLRLTDRMLQTVVAGEEVQQWSWDNVSLISVGVVPSTSPGHFHPAPAAAAGSSHRLWNEGVTVAAKRRPEVFLVLCNGEQSLRFSSDEMNYEYLNDRLNTSSTVNFRQVIKDLTGSAKSAWTTPSTRAFLDRSPVRHYEFHSLEDLRRYTEFQTLLSRQLRGCREA